MKKHVWVQPSEFEKKMRASASGRVMHVISRHVEDKPIQYFSASQGTWIDTTIRNLGSLEEQHGRGTWLEIDETTGKLRLAADPEKPIVAQPTEEHDALFSEVDDAIADVLRNGDMRLVSGLWLLEQMEQAPHWRVKRMQDMPEEAFLAPEIAAQLVLKPLLTSIPKDYSFLRSQSSSVCTWGVSWGRRRKNGRPERPLRRAINLMSE